MPTDPVLPGGTYTPPSPTSPVQAGGAHTPPSVTGPTQAGGGYTPPSPATPVIAGGTHTPPSVTGPTAAGGAYSPPEPTAPVIPGGAYTPPFNGTASLTVDPAGANNALVLTAVEPGAAGNLLNFTANDTATLAGATAGVSAALSGDDITVTMRQKWTMTLAGTLAYNTEIQGTVPLAGVFEGNGSVFTPMPDPPQWIKDGVGGRFLKIGVRSNKWCVIGALDLGNEVNVAEQSSGVAADYATPDLVPAWTTLGGATGTVSGITAGYPIATRVRTALSAASAKATAANAPGNDGSGTFATVPKTFFTGGGSIVPPVSPGS